uniref:S5 DRBM domain-containing protein n=1 Tax=Ananas comosus var. bracteatus TaxID=296719 RepID=A0A6V7PY25_ANACO|nr:unnamed protein product [Ananas comosus var. bracteatus]
MVSRCIFKLLRGSRGHPDKFSGFPASMRIGCGKPIPLAVLGPTDILHPVGASRSDRHRWVLRSEVSTKLCKIILKIFGSKRLQQGVAALLKGFKQSQQHKHLPIRPSLFLVPGSAAAVAAASMAAAGATRGKAPWALLLRFRSYARPRLFSAPKPYHNPTSPLPCFFLLLPSRPFSANPNPVMGHRVVQELLAEAERERQREREERRKAGVDVADDDDEEEEDYMGVGPLIEKLEKKRAREADSAFDMFWEPTDSDSDEDDERFSPDEIKKRLDEFDRKCKRHSELLKNFAEAETLDEAHKWMTKIDKFEQRHLKLPLEYRVIGDMMNRLKESTGKERFILLQKLNRAVRLMECKEAYDPNNPANFGVIQHQQVGSPDDLVDNAGFEKEKQMIQGARLEEDDEDFSEAKERDDALIEKLNAIEKKLEEKLAELDHTFGKKGRALEEEIKDLVEERNSLTDKREDLSTGKILMESPCLGHDLLHNSFVDIVSLGRKGFDVKVIDVNRTCKVTKGGQVAKYTALLATGNYHGVVGFAKAKGPTAKIAIQRAYEKCFQNLHYIERYEDHTIAHAIHTKYEKTKIIGSRNPLNVIKALFKALNAIETPKDVQEKFGRTVVESYLM